ncbi:MAG: sensor histidine kinase [Longimicrobiaceae bacterium]
MAGSKLGAEARASGRSLRAELLFNLTFLAAAALVLALWTVAMVRLPAFSSGSFWLLAALVGVDVLVFVLLGRYLIDRMVTRPLAGAVSAAERIADGEFGMRLPAGETREVAALTRAINHLTDQLLDNQRRLAENVRSLDETNRALVDTQRDLVQAEKLASIGRLAAGVAHEVGNPLGSILGYLAVLRRRRGDSELVDGAEGEARRIDRIVRGLLEYARPAATRREPVDVNGCARRALETLRGRGRLAGVEVELALAEGLPPVAGVPHRLEQLFENLFTNAEDVMPEGGKIFVSSTLAVYQGDPPPPARRADDPPEVDYSHLRRDRRRPPPALRGGEPIVRVTVADTGPGVPAGDEDRVFDPFFTTKEPGRGTGLGLAIVAGVAAECGGRAEASAGRGGGARFTISFPLFPAAGDGSDG